MLYNWLDVPILHWEQTGLWKSQIPSQLFIQSVWNFAHASTVLGNTEDSGIQNFEFLLQVYSMQNHDAKLLVRAFVTYVQPILECNTVIWSPCTARDIDSIECVQRRFTKSLCGYSHFSNSKRLSCLKLKSLEYRRLYFGATKLCITSSTFLLTSCFVLAHVPTHMGMRTNCVKVDHWSALRKTISAKGSSVFGQLYLSMLLISHRFL